MAPKKRTNLLTASDRRLLKEFGDKIRKIRESKGLTVYDLTGDDMPIRSRQHWQRIENGQKNVNITTAMKIAKSLKVSPGEIFSSLG